MDISRTIESSPASDAQWSVAVVSGKQSFSYNSQAVLRTASVAKIFVLIELAARMHTGSLQPTERIPRDSTSAVNDAGLWQHLDNPEMTLNDLARLVGTCSDNWATNALIECLGLPSVQERAASLCPDRTTLHDYIRKERRSPLPAAVSTGTASDWAVLMQILSQGEVVNHEVSKRVMSWLSTCMDLSMVPGDFGLDPLSHSTSNGNDLSVTCKTGTDSGVRADVGIVRKNEHVLSYAVICNWSESSSGVEVNDVLHTMRKIGTNALTLL